MTRTCWVLACLVICVPLIASAQNNELGVFISTSQFEDSEIDDAGDIFDVEFDEDMGYGILYNRYWTNSFSTEFAYQKLGADLTVSFEDIAADAGDLNLDVLSATAQIHFARNSMISPYIGGGAAYVSGEAGSIDTDELEDADLENEIDFLVNAGLNLNLGKEHGGPLTDWSIHTAAVTLGVVAGFLTLIPGGFGARELALVYLLKPIYGEAVALVSTIVLRLVWLAAEVILSTAFHSVGPRR